MKGLLLIEDISMRSGNRISMKVEQDVYFENKETLIDELEERFGIRLTDVCPYRDDRYDFIDKMDNDRSYAIIISKI